MLEINHSNTGSVSFSYTGQYKNIFDNSSWIAEQVKDIMFSYHGPELPVNQSAEKAVSLLDIYLQQIVEIQTNVKNRTTSTFLANYVGDMVSIIKKQDLLKRYSNNVREQRRIGLDSLAATDAIPLRDKDFYSGLIEKEDSVMGWLHPLGYRDLISSILKELELDFKPLSQCGIKACKAQLVNLFCGKFIDQNDLFYDVALVIAHLDKITTEGPLSDLERAQLPFYIHNKNMVSYIFHADDLSRQQQTNNYSNSKYLFPFENKEQDVMQAILSKYKGKSIVIDFWATWCGPCLKAFDDMKKVKAEYATKKDLVFVYLTNESSNLGMWNDAVSSVNGEHYFLYNEQFEKITKKYGIKFLPSYLFFSKNGNLRQSHTKGYEGNEKFSKVLKKLTKAR